MKLNELVPNQGSNKKRMRVGRGIGSGKGKTCGVGVKGQKARSGVAIDGFEGGQMPLYMRLPKSGFSNVAFRTKLVEVTLQKLQYAVESGKIDAKKTIDEDALVAGGVLRNKKDGVKLIGNGEFKGKLDLKLTKVSAAAREAIEKAGGKIELIVREVAPVVRKKPR
jgi:large subunit ribosomal protein L15